MENWVKEGEIIEKVSSPCRTAPDRRGDERRRARKRKCRARRVRAGQVGGWADHRFLWSATCQSGRGYYGEYPYDVIRLSDEMNAGCPTWRLERPDQGVSCRRTHEEHIDDLEDRYLAEARLEKRVLR